MTNAYSLESSAASQPDAFTIRDFRHEVAHVSSITTDKSFADNGLIFYTEEVEMDDGIRYIVTTNTIESQAEIERNPADKEFPGANILTLENTAWTTKYGHRTKGFYRSRHIRNALELHRPTMITGVQQNWNRYVNFHRCMEDELAIYAFMAARFGYDQDYATAMGTSRGGMGALLKQKIAPKFGKRILHANAQVPCIPYVSDTARMFTPWNLLRTAVNEVAASRELGLSRKELFEMRDDLDVLTVLGLAQQAKEGIALGTSGIGHIIRKSPHKDDVGDIHVQKGDGLSFADRWPILYEDHENMNVTVHDGGGHASSAGRGYHEDWFDTAQDVASVLHAHPEHRKLGGAAFRSLLTQHNARKQAA